MFWAVTRTYPIQLNCNDSRDRGPGGCCCCCCCSHINSHNQVRGHRTGSSHSEAEEYPREKHKQWYTQISQLIQFMPPPETYKSEIGGQSMMCQVYTGAHVSLLAPGKTDYTACHPRKTTTYILHVVSITTHTHDRRKSIGKRNKEQIRRERERHKREESEKRKRKRKGKKRKDKKSKKRQDEKRKQGKEKRKKISY